MRGRGPSVRSRPNTASLRPAAGPLACILVIVLAACGTSETTASTTPSPSRVATHTKVFAYVAATIQTSTAIQRDVKSIESVKSPVYGISWRFKWSVIEPADGQFSWGLIDQALAASRALGKKVLLRVIPGSYTPGWLIAESQAISFPNSIFPNPVFYPPVVTMPVPWDPTYLAKWEEFVRAFGQRYDGNDVLFNVGTGGGGVIDEMYVPPAYTEWQAVGYSDSKLIGAWKSIIDAFQSAFPTTPTSLDIDEPLGVGHSHVLQPVVDYCLSSYPGRIYMQQNGLRANYGQGPATQEYEQILDRAAHLTQIGLQMFGGRGPADAKTGDRLTAFQVALRLHVDYIEVYLTDLVDPTLSQAVAVLTSGSGQ
jgi:Beta-galactosidase